MSQQRYAIEKIIGHQIRNGKMRLKVHWTGYPVSEATDEGARKMLRDARAVVKDYLRGLSPRVLTAPAISKIAVLARVIQPRPAGRQRVRGGARARGQAAPRRARQAAQAATGGARGGRGRQAAPAPAPDAGQAAPAVQAAPAAAPDAAQAVQPAVQPAAQPAARGHSGGRDRQRAPGAARLAPPLPAIQAAPAAARDAAQAAPAVQAAPALAPDAVQAAPAVQPAARGERGGRGRQRAPGAACLAPAVQAAPAPARDAAQDIHFVAGLPRRRPFLVIRGTPSPDPVPEAPAPAPAPVPRAAQAAPALAPAAPAPAPVADQHALQVGALPGAGAAPPLPAVDAAAPPNQANQDRFFINGLVNGINGPQAMVVITNQRTNEIQVVGLEEAHALLGFQLVRYLHTREQ